jgi:hypothetical protein
MTRCRHDVDDDDVDDAYVCSSTINNMWGYDFVTSRQKERKLSCLSTELIDDDEGFYINSPSREMTEMGIHKVDKCR